ncbi:response regulator SirA [bacterium]|nr:response regulator SirA [bacterium]
MYKQNKLKWIIKRNGRSVKFDQQRITNAIFKAELELGYEDIPLAERISDKVVEHLNEIYTNNYPPSVEEIQDIVIETLKQEGRTETAFAYSHYRNEQARKREQKNAQVITNDRIPYKLLWEEYVWNVEHNCDSVAKLNKIIEIGEFPELVAETEKLYTSRIEDAVAKILARKDAIKFVIVAGPSSSGKTTTTIRISEELKKHRIEFKSMVLDNYYKNLEEQPKDEFGDYDFETPEALDLELINDHFSRIMKGETVQMPIFDFQEGNRAEDTVPFKLEPNQMLLLDSLHGLYDKLTASIDKENMFKLYIETLSQIKDLNNEFIRWTDIRLLRRCIRDSWSRNYDPFMTVGHWHYVRRSEMQHIVPFIGTVDHIFNGSLQYELPVLKKHLWKYFKDVVKLYENKPRRFDAFIRAQRVHDLLETVHDVSDEDEHTIPRNSLMREYIGGSVYEY